jgi:hypothetical protein
MIPKMRRLLILLTVAALPVAATAQSPSDGHVTTDSYLNPYFHFSYSWPKELRPVNSASMNLHAPAGSTNEFFLFSAKSPDAPFGVVVIAEKPNSHTPNPDGLNESQTFLEHVKQWWDPAGHPKILAETHAIKGEDLTFYELDYVLFGEYSSAIATQMGDFQIVFKCNAESAAELSALTKSVLATYRTK